MTFVSMYTTKNCLKSGRPITNRKIRYPFKYYFVFKNSKKMSNKKGRIFELDSNKCHHYILNHFDKITVQ